MSGPFYGYPPGGSSTGPNTMNHVVEPSYSTYAGASVGDSTYLASSSTHGFPTSATSGHAFPSTSSLGQNQGENTPGSSKRPFPWASGSGSQERDKRARSCDGSGSGFMSTPSGNPAEEEPEQDGEDGMSTDESAYASAAESPAFTRSPTRVDTPRSRPLPPVEEYEDRTDSAAYTSNSGPGMSGVPRIPTPAALRSSSPLGLLDVSTAPAPPRFHSTPSFSSAAQPFSAGQPFSSSNQVFPPSSNQAYPSTTTQAFPSTTNQAFPTTRLASLRSPLPPSRPSRAAPLSIHALAESRNSSRYDIANGRNDLASDVQSTHGPVQSAHGSVQGAQGSMQNTINGQHDVRGQHSDVQPANGHQLDLGWLTQQLDEALPPPRSLEPFSSTRSPEPFSSNARSVEQLSTRPTDPYSSTRSLEPEVPTHPSRGFSGSYGSGSVDSALPLSAHSRAGTGLSGHSRAGTGTGRVPLPWVDIEHEGDELAGSIGDELSSSGVAGMTSEPSLSSVDARLGQSLSSIDARLASPAFGSPAAGSTASTVRSEGSDGSGSGANTQVGPLQFTASTARTEQGVSTIRAERVMTTPTRPERVTSPPSRAEQASPSTSGSSASTRTTPQGPAARRPLSLNLHLRAYPASPTLSLSGSPTAGSIFPPLTASPTFSTAAGSIFPPLNGSPTFSTAGQPTFPTSASPRTSTFDLAVTPPGSALPSFVARMMEVDSPVREGTGGDGTGHAYSPLGSPTENNTASIDALRRFVENNEADGGRDSLGASPIQALTDVAVGSYFPDSPPSGTGQESLQFTLHGESGVGGQHESATSGYTSQSTSEYTAQPASEYTAQPANGYTSQPTTGYTPQPNGHTSQPTSDHTSQPSEGTHQPEPSWSSRPSDLNSIYSRRLTESGVSFPSRPSDSGASLPSFRAAVSPEPGLNMGSRPGRVVRDMSWSFSDLFRPAHEGPSHGGSSEMPSGSGSETSLRTRVESEGRASVRNALTRAVGIGTGSTRGSEGLPRLHLNALPRMNGPGLEQQDEQRSTNLSRTPPALGPTSHAVPSLSEAWFEESSSTRTRPAQPSGSRRLSVPRWTDLLPEAPAPVAAPMPSSRPRMPPLSTDSSSYDYLNGSWGRSTHNPPVPYVDSSLSTSQTPQDSAAAALARYQTFAQSIEEIRRSPSELFPSAQRNSASSSVATTGLSGSRSSMSLVPDETSARPAWALPRREPPSFQPPQRTRNPYGNPYIPPTDNHRSPTPPARPLSESFESRPPDGNWLRDWEMQRDMRSRAVREDYFRRRNTVSSSNSTPSAVEAGPSESTRRPHPLAQLSDTQAQGQMWGEFNASHRPRPRPMTRASLVATGFGDNDLANDWSNTSNGQRLSEVFPHPPRRPGIVPPREDDNDSTMQFSTSTDDDGMGGMLFTESPPSMLEDPTESPYELSNLPFPRSNAPPEFDPGHAVTSRRGPSPSHELGGSLGRRPLGMSAPPMRDQSERTRLATPRGWESTTARPYTQLERVRQLLHPRSSESRDQEPSRRHPSDLSLSSTTQPRRSSFLSGLDTSTGLSSDSTSSLRRSSMPWLHNEPASAIETHAPRPFPSRENDHPEWPSTEASSRSSLTHELLRASSVRRRRRTLLPESTSRRDSHGFLNSVNSALHQVESGLLHINRELNALANDEPNTTPPVRMDWAFDQIEQRPPSPPPRLPPFNFSSLQQNSDWPASRRNPHDPEPEPPRRALPGYLDSRQPPRGYDYSWRNEGLPSEVWSNEGTGSNMPLRDRLLFRASAHPPPTRSNSIGSSFQPQAQAQPGPGPAFARLNRRRPSPPVPSPSTSTAGSLLRPFTSQTTATSPPNPRSYTSRFSHFLPRRSSGRAGGTGSSDDNDDWHHPHVHPTVDQSSTRRFFIRARGRSTRGGAIPNGDFMRDEEFDDSYEGLLRLAARIGDAKPRGTPAEVIRAMPCCSYAEATGAEKETRCPICLDDYAQEDGVSMIKQCAHWFHRECIQQWLSNSRTCPVCRGQADGEGDSSPGAGPSSSVPENPWM